MSEPITFVVVGEPKPKGSKRQMLSKSGQPYFIEDNPGTRPWMRNVKNAAKAVMGDRRPIVGPVTTHITFRFTRPKTVQDRAYPCTPPDLDKLLRAVYDSITKVVIYDDALVVGETSMKLYAENDLPGVTVIVKEVAG